MKHRVIGRFVLADETPLVGQIVAVAERGGETIVATLRKGEVPDSFKLSPGRYALSVVDAGETMWGPQTVDVPFFCRRVDLNRTVPV